MEKLEDDEWAIWRYYVCPPKMDMSAEVLRNYFPVLDTHDPDGTDPHCQDFREAAEIYLNFAEGKITESEVSNWESARKQRKLVDLFERVKERHREKYKDRE